MAEARENMRGELPTGTVTLLMTDIEASTQKWERYPGAMRHAVALHDTLLRKHIEQQGGSVVKTGGDSFFAAFTTANSAAHAAIDIQLSLRGVEWPCPEPLKVRAALNTGFLTPEGRDYYGPPVNRLARMVEAGHGGQILVSDTTANLLSLGGGWQLRDLGHHRLAGIAEPQRILQLEHPELDAHFPSLRTPEYQPNNLPVEVTEFVGREWETEVLAKLLRKPETVLVTLTGPGGVGKSRLAARVGEDLMPHFEHGVWWVPLASLPQQAGEAELACRVMAAMRIGKGDGDCVEELVAGLKGRRALLIWDNFEHQIDSAPLVATLMRNCPELTQLVTSRELLRLAGEIEWVVDTLPRAEAVRLFETRARQVNPGFSVGPENREVVEQACEQLDRLPLAVELAAAQARIFTPKQILDRLGNRFELLATEQRDVEERQRSLAAAIDWSYEGLTESEKETFRNLCILSGTFSLDAAEAVSQSPEVLATVAGLREKSLLRTVEVGGEIRFGFLGSIREYGLTKLAESGDMPELKRRHVKYYTTLLEDLGKEFPWFTVESARRLVRARDQIRAAGGYAADLPDKEPIANFLGAMARLPLSLQPMPLAESVAALERNLPLVRQYCSTETVAQLLFMLGALRILTLGDTQRARELIDQALGTIRSLGKGPILSVYLGTIAVFMTDRSDELLAELEHLAESGDGLAVWCYHHALATLLIQANKLNLAYSHAETAVKELRWARDPQLLYASQVTLADLASRRNDPREARRILNESNIGDIDDINYQTAISALLTYADAEAALGDADAASEWYSRAVELAEQTDDSYTASLAHSRLSELAIPLGNLDLAEEHCRKARKWLGNMESPAYRMPYRFAEAQLALARERPVDALASLMKIASDVTWPTLGPWRERKVALAAAAAWLRGDGDLAARLFGFALRDHSPLFGSPRSVKLVEPYWNDFRKHCPEASRDEGESAVVNWSIQDTMTVADEAAVEAVASQPHPSAMGFARTFARQK